MDNPILTGMQAGGSSAIVQSGLAQNYQYASYMNILERFYSQKPGTILVPSMLRTEVVLGTQNQIIFNLGASQNAQPWEVRLDQNDAFHIMGFSVALARYNATTNGTTAILHYYPNTNVFAATAPNLEAIYNGTLNAVINSRQVYKNVPLNKAKFVGQAQQGLSLYSGTVVAGTQQQYTASQISQDIEVPIVPTLMVNGKSTPQMTINLGTGVNLGATLPDQNVCVLLLYGFLAQNVN